jgi:hypothetical protein
LLLVLIQTINAVSLETNDIHQELLNNNQESAKQIDYDDYYFIKRHVNTIGHHSNNNKRVNNIDFKKTMQHFLSLHGNQSILKKAKGSIKY